MGQPGTTVGPCLGRILGTVARHGHGPKMPPARRGPLSHSYIHIYRTNPSIFLISSLPSSWHSAVASSLFPSSLPSSSGLSPTTEHHHGTTHFLSGRTRVPAGKPRGLPPAGGKAAARAPPLGGVPGRLRTTAAISRAGRSGPSTPSPPARRMAGRPRATAAGARAGMVAARLCRRPPGGWPGVPIGTKVVESMNLYVYLYDGSMNLLIVWWFSLIHLELIGISRALVICSAGPGTSPSMARRASGRPGGP
jgi:hypothetical protein